jgi:hypothetical protein
VATLARTGGKTWGMNNVRLLVVLLPWSFVAGPAHAAEKKPAVAAVPNTVTAAEKAAGWRLLFDGKTTTGWRGVKKDGFPGERWVVDGGVLKCVGGKNNIDIITIDQYDSFEFSWQWRLSAGANSGVKYLVDETISKPGFGIGFEYQLIDDDKHPDARAGRDGNRTAGALYDLIAPGKDKLVHPPGEWNESRLLVDGNHVEHWLNGKKVLSFERGSPEFKDLIARSKYKSIAGFGAAPRGHLLLQDHETEVAFRNLKLRAPLRK